MSEVNGFQPPEESSFQAPEASASQEGGSNWSFSVLNNRWKCSSSCSSAAADDQQQTSVVEVAREDRWQTQTEAIFSRWGQRSNSRSRGSTEDCSLQCQRSVSS